MASRNFKPKNSSDSEGEAEWTFIDTDEGTIETRKDSVTYRKPTYSEILKGVVTEDLVEEVDSEPEFEVLASFKFRPKGESFGLGSSALRPPKNAKVQGKGSSHEVDGDNEPPNGNDSSCSDDGIMIISSHLTGEDKADEDSNSKVPLKASNDNDYNKINNVGSLDDKSEDRETDVDKNTHDEDEDFVITDETESDFEEATINNTTDDNKDEEKISKSRAENLNASTIKEATPLNEGSHDNDSDSDNHDNNDDGFLGIHKGGICDNPEKDLDWDSLTFQLLSTLPRLSLSTTTLEDDNKNPKSQDGIIDSIQDSDSESDSHSSYAAISQDDKQDDTSSFDELSDSADVNRDFSSEPMIPQWLFNADKDPEDEIESLDDDSDYIISDIEELQESGLIPQWFFDPSHKVHLDKSVDGGFELINSDLDDLSKDPVIPVCLYNPSYKVIDTNGSFDDDIEEPNPIIPQWFFDPNYKIQDLNEMFDDDTDYTDYTDYDSDDGHDSSMTLPRWLFDKNFKPPDQNEEEFSWPSQLFVDIPTFIILLCLTTALGFSIGHGLTVYLSNQSINRNAKLQNMETPAKQFPSSLEELGLTPEEIARIDLLRLEDELHQQKESDMLSNHLRFDLREIYKSLKDKHYRLLRNQKSTEDRLHIRKTMSWYWRMRYDEEKRRNKVTGLPTNLRPKNFKDMANLARKTKLAKKWRRQYKENYTAQWLGKSNPLNSNLRWLVKPLDATLKQDKRLGRRYLMKAMALSKDKDMKNFRKRWTQDLKDLKQKSCRSNPPTNKSIQLKKKTTVSSPFTWINDSRDCKRAKRKDILGLCLAKKPSLVKKKNNPITEKLAKEDSGRKNNNVEFKPCFSKPKNNSKIKQTSSKNKGKLSSRVSRDPKRNSGNRAYRQEKVRSERIKKRKLKKEALEIKNQVDELKAVLVELRRERRRAEKEKAKLEASWRKLKRQRLQFEKKRKEKQKRYRRKNKIVSSKLTREKTRLKTWKNVAKRAQKKAHALQKNLKLVSVAKQELKYIKNIKKNLKIEKRKLREQQKNLKSIKQQLRKEHRNYAREKWKTKKKRRQMEKQRISKSKPIGKNNKAKKQNKTSTNRKKAEKHQSQRSSSKRSQDKKKQKPQKKFWENVEKSLYEWAQKVNRTIEHHRRGKASKVWKELRAQFDKFVAWTKEPKKKEDKVKKQEKKRSNGMRTEKHQTEQSSNKHSEDKNKKQKPQKKFWENVEKSLYEWAQGVNRTIRHHRRGKVSKIWKRLRAQFDNLVAWTTGKKYSKATGPVKKKKEHRSENKIKNPVFEKILAEQMKYEEEKRNSQKGSENQWKSRSPVVNKKIKVHDVKKKKKKKERKKKDPKTSLKQRQRKQRRKYQRELERLQQWALQMNEKKLEHERIYRKKEKKSRKRFKSDRNHPKLGAEEGAAKGRDLVSVEDSNSTFMLLPQPQVSTSADCKTPKNTRKEQSRYQDRESIIREVTKSQINHDSNKKKTQTSVTLPIEDDVIKLPDDVDNRKEPGNPLDVTSFGDESRSSPEPTPPSFSPTFYKDLPIIGILSAAKRKSDGSIGEGDILSSDSPKDPETSQNGDNGQRTDPWYMRRAEQREEFHDTDTGLTLSPRLVGPLKSDGTWFFQRSSDRALQRKLYEPLNRQSARDGFKHNAWRSYFHRGRRRSAMNDGEWVFEQASDHAEQRSNDEPWYMRRAEGRKEDREENKDSWFIERGFDRDILHHYDEDDEDDDLMNDEDDYADHSFEEEYEDAWL